MPPNEFARRYLEDLLSFFGLNTRVEDNFNEEDRVVELVVPSSALNGFLIGQRGRNLHSIQHLLNLVVRKEGYEEVAVVVDIAGYKREHYDRLSRQAENIARSVVESGIEQALEPMSAAERRAIHQAISAIEGVNSESAGEGRDRHVVIKSTKKPKT